MPTSYVVLLSVLALIVAGVLLDWWRSKRLFCGPLPRPFRHRDSQEPVWRQDYRDEMLGKVDALLALVCEVFCFNPDDRYQFAPTDRIMDIYRACYPRWQFWKLADSMELEQLMIELKEQFGVEDKKRHSDITLGELVEVMKSVAPTKKG